MNPLYFCSLRFYREKMYNTYFKKWRPLFNKNKRPNAGSANKQGIRIPRTRPRRLQSHPKDSSTHRSKRCIRPYSFCGPQLSDGYTKQMVVMNLTEVYVYGLFDTFNFSSSPFDIIVPFGTPDHSLVWQQTSDECFGATTLMLKDNFVKGFRTFSILCEWLKVVLGNNNYVMIIKFWRICLRLYKMAL
jgi:hypothetical protein